MAEQIRFKLAHAGATYRFCSTQRDAALLHAVRQHVAKCIKQEKFELFWNDDESDVVLDTVGDLSTAIDFARCTRKRPTSTPCIRLAVSVSAPAVVEKQASILASTPSSLPSSVSSITPSYLESVLQILEPKMDVAVDTPSVKQVEEQLAKLHLGNPSEISPEELRVTEQPPPTTWEERLTRAKQAKASIRKAKETPKASPKVKEILPMEVAMEMAMEAKKTQPKAPAPAPHPQMSFMQMRDLQMAGPRIAAQPPMMQFPPPRAVKSSQEAAEQLQREGVKVKQFARPHITSQQQLCYSEDLRAVQLLPSRYQQQPATQKMDAQPANQIQQSQHLPSYYQQSMMQMQRFEEAARFLTPKKPSEIPQDLQIDASLKESPLFREFMEHKKMRKEELNKSGPFSMQQLLQEGDEETVLKPLKPAAAPVLLKTAQPLVEKESIESAADMGASDDSFVAMLASIQDAANSTRKPMQPTYAGLLYSSHELAELRKKMGVTPKEVKKEEMKEKKVVRKEECEFLCYKPPSQLQKCWNAPQLLMKPAKEVNTDKSGDALQQLQQEGVVKKGKELEMMPWEAPQSAAYKAAWSMVTQPVSCQVSDLGSLPRLERKIRALEAELEQEKLEKSRAEQAEVQAYKAPVAGESEELQKLRKVREVSEMLKPQEALLKARISEVEEMMTRQEKRSLDLAAREEQLQIREKALQLKEEEKRGKQAEDLAEKEKELKMRERDLEMKEETFQRQIAAFAVRMEEMERKFASLNERVENIEEGTEVERLEMRLDVLEEKLDKNEEPELEEDVTQEDEEEEEEEEEEEIEDDDDIILMGVKVVESDEDSDIEIMEREEEDDIEII